MSSLYRHFDEKGRLLYVGVSLSAIKRLGDHAHHSAWFKEIRRVEIQPCQDRQAALKAEREAVATENPVCNIRLKKLPPPPKPTIEASRRELTGRLVSFRPIYTPNEAADILNLTPTIVKRLIASTELGHVLLNPRREFHAGRPCPPRVAVTGWQIIDYIEALEAKAAPTATRIVGRKLAI